MINKKSKPNCFWVSIFPSSIVTFSCVLTRIDEYTNKIKTPLLLPLFFQDDHYLILVISEPQCFRPNWELSEAIVLSKPKVNNGLRRKILLREWFKQIFSRYELSTQKVIISPMQCRHCALGGLITKNRPETTIFK